MASAQNNGWRKRLDQRIGPPKRASAALVGSARKGKIRTSLSLTVLAGPESVVRDRRRRLAIHWGLAPVARPGGKPVILAKRAPIASKQNTDAAPATTLADAGPASKTAARPEETNRAVESNASRSDVPAATLADATPVFPPTRMIRMRWPRRRRRLAAIADADSESQGEPASLDGRNGPLRLRGRIAWSSG